MKTPQIAQIEDGYLVIRIPLQAPTRSASGKTLTVATTNGFTATPAQLDGKPVHISVNAYVKP